MRRAIRPAIALLVVALVVTATAAAARWVHREPVNAGIVITGDFELHAEWLDAPASWPALFPGESREASMRIWTTAVGETLRWRAAVDGSVAADFSDHVLVETYQGTCAGASAPLDLPLHPAAAPLAAGEELLVCVRFTLSTSAGQHSALQGQPLDPVVVVTGVQAGG